MRFAGIFGAPTRVLGALVLLIGSTQGDTPPVSSEVAVIVQLVDAILTNRPYIPPLGGRLIPSFLRGSGRSGGSIEAQVDEVDCVL
eukprot:6458171-Amphidinium_carterae.1